MIKNQHFRMAFIIISLFFLISACSVRKSQPLQGTLEMEDQSVRNGEIHFMAYCQKCHPIGESGLGPALNINPAPKFAKQFQVRHGLGVMPAFSEDEISDKELDEILKYLTALKKNK